MKRIGCTLYSSAFTPIVDGALSHETGSAVAIVLGDVFDLNHNPLFPASIIELFDKLGCDLCSTLTGNYTIIVFNKHKEKVYAFQNALGSSLFLYYTIENGRLYLNTSLYAIIEQSGKLGKLNDKIIPHFLLNGFVIGSSTLLDGIWKLVPGCMLEADADGIVQRPCRYNHCTIMADAAAASWNDTLSEILEKCYSKGTNIALSSGYDSNYILHYGAKKGLEQINAYSIGGDFDGNELPAVEKIATLYPLVHLNCATTDRETFLHFPDIVRRLEGQVYERGIFLQYELAKLAAQNNASTLICGECANEVMSIDFMVNQDFDIQPQAIATYALDPYTVASYVIIKKSGILLNSFGIDSSYPFADQSVINLSHSLRYNNCQSKSFHIDNCKRLFAENVYSLLGNRGGSTKETSFLDEANLELLNALMRNNSYYAHYGQILFDAKYAAPKSVQRTPNYNTNIRNPFKLYRSEIAARKSDRAQLETEKADAEVKTKLICLFLDLFHKNLEQKEQGKVISDYYHL